jgi:hypothetical protein
LSVAGVALCACGPFACFFAGLAVGFAGVAGCESGGVVVTALPVSFAERVARKAAAQSAMPSKAMSTGRGRVITAAIGTGAVPV